MGSKSLRVNYKNPPLIVFAKGSLYSFVVGQFLFSIIFVLVKLIRRREMLWQLKDFFN
jgi:hypothetical protein